MARIRTLSLPETCARFALGGIFMVAVSLVFFLMMLFLMPWRVLRLKVCNVYGKLVGHAITALTGAPLIFRHRERLNGSHPAIYVSNHTSTLDIWLGMWLCPFGGAGLAKKEIVKVPGLGQLYVLSGHPLIDRSNRERAIATMNDVAEFMNKNRLSLWIWPEGTRSKTGELGPFKKGFVHAAIATGLPVVPVVVYGAAKVWPRKGLRLTTHPLHIETLPAVDTSDWSAETLDAHVEALRQIFLDALQSGPHNP
jgi:1-acyl-sn-glycerol-3-phosphate acyltransferase